MIEFEMSPQLKRNLQALSPAQITEGAMIAIRREAEKVLSDSLREVPVRDGPLKDSGRVVGPEVAFAAVAAAVTYGGAAKAYARRQHEETTWRHTVGKAKYLEDPAMRHASGPFVRGFGETMWTWIKTVTA